jgi:hypothetical protein
MWKSIECAWYLSVITERYQAHSIDFHIICLSILLTCNVPNEGYYRKVSSTLNLQVKRMERHIMWKSIECAWYLSVLTFIRYVQLTFTLFVFPFFWLVAYLMKVITEMYQAHSINFHIICLSILLTCNVPNEGYYRKVSSTLNWTSNVKVNWVCLIPFCNNFH